METMNLKKYTAYMGFCFFAASLMAGCDASEFDFDSGWDDNKADSSDVKVDTLQGIDASMYEKARVFPGLVDTLKERTVKDTAISLDLSLKYVDMVDAGFKYKYSSEKKEFPNPIYSTGLYAGAGEQVTINVPDNVWGLTAQIGVHTEDLTDKDGGMRQPIVYIQKELFPGKNTLRSPMGGYLWILRNKNVQGAKDVKLEVKNVYKAVDFISGQTEKNLSAWAKEVQASTVPWLDVRGKHVTFSVDRLSVERALASNPNYGNELQKALAQWDKLMEVYYQTYGLEENAADVKNLMPQYPDRFVFDVKLSNNAIANIQNPQALMLAKTPSWSNALLNPDSVTQLKIGTMYKVLSTKYAPEYGFSASLASEVPLWRVAEANKKEGLIADYPDFGIGFDQWAKPLLSYAAADSSKTMGDAWLMGNKPTYPSDAIRNENINLLMLVQLAKYYKYKFPDKNEWDFLRELYKAGRFSRNFYGDLDFMEQVCSVFHANMFPFFAHWGWRLADDQTKAKYESLPLVSDALWQINPLADNPLNGMQKVDVANYKYTVDRSNWRIKSFDQDGNDNFNNTSDKESNWDKPKNLFDGNTTTYWSSYWKDKNEKNPKVSILVIDMGKLNTIDGFYLANGTTGNPPMKVDVQILENDNADYEDLKDIYGDQRQWSSVGKIDWSAQMDKYRKNETYWQFTGGSKTARYIRIVMKDLNLGYWKDMQKPDYVPPLTTDYNRGYIQKFSEFGVYYYKK